MRLLLLFAVAHCWIPVHSWHSLWQNSRPATRLNAKSRLTDFARQYLDDDPSSNNQEPSGPSLLVAVPLDECHDLAIELESIQRAVLYHCPLLATACVPTSRLRLPLFSVQGATQDELQSVLQQAKDECCKRMIEETEEDDQESPWMLTFQGLLNDNDSNSNDRLWTQPQNKDILRSFFDVFSELAIQRNWVAKEVASEVVFMELPKDWNDILEKEHGTTKFLTAEEGGNGISPLFWGTWMDDELGGATRLPSIAIYDGSFPYPTAAMVLPEGNSMQQEQEAKMAAYQQQRVDKAEEEWKREKKRQENGEDDEYEEPYDETDMMFTKTRDRLEELYTKAASVTKGVPQQEEQKEEEVLNLSPNKPEAPVDKDAIDDWTRQRIEAAVSNRERVKSLQKLAEPKNVPPVEENKAFAEYKEAIQRPKEVKKEETYEVKSQVINKDSCVGFWNMLDSEEADQSDNLILRVDGSIAGGPVLEKATRQKAAGGSWSYEGGLLRIRLIIPPARTRALVMEGQLEQVMPSAQKPGTFGIPQLEKLQERADRKASSLYCKGEMWMEDAASGRDRSEVLGPFALQKLATPQDNYVITIPQSVRNQD